MSKRIEFGYANEMNPSGSWEGIGINQSLLLTDAEYYGSIQYGDESLIIAKVLKDEYGRFPELLDKFIVREALVDLYKDGSGILFLNQEKTLICKKLEELLNRKQIIEKITDINSIKNICSAGGTTRAFDMIAMDDTIVATSIKPLVFKDKKDAINRCRGSISNMQKQLEEKTNNFSR